ncbi:sigma 54-interacting transcriptional regulator [Desulfosporosinus metallidurans]|uniref:Response regulator of zinc sigma-54-dependent two-component system n=1 Tax=Desulfosporosinus metallidurans TaxID=1888891 RepID=A0A1Q8QYT6_9FIRM|nr:sigma 54-interacting transcriptional regulator [Desulfosporosinus metallidurans]OLN32539.1 Response regulator of zinc sigma-54-dependent two-component system [Desulfosporosinus metallidurans]
MKPNQIIKLDQVFQAINAGIIVINDQDLVCYCNPVAAHLIGLGMQDILNKKITEVIPNSELFRVLQEEESNADQLMIGDRMVITSRSPIDQDGKMVGAVAVFQDGSELQRVLSRLDNTQNSLTGLENIFEQAYDGVMVVDSQGIVTRITKTYCRFLNIAQEDAVGRHCTEILPTSRMHIVAQTGHAEIGEVMDINGKEAMVMRLPLRENGKLIGAVGKVMFRDVQDLRTLAEKLDVLENKLKFYEKELKHYQKFRYTFSNIIGKSQAILQTKVLAEKAALGKSTVLLRGESGTGKELFAHAIHAASLRHDQPFVRVNCGAIPAELLESELFGYEEGAFTGAKKGGKPGKFELANKGTIFLDEIGDLPLGMQAKVLRILQEKEVERVGSNRLQHLDIRVIAATHRDLEKMMNVGEFRRDLYYRLNVFTVTIPPLRERERDVLLLSEHLLDKFQRELGSSVKILDRRVAELFQLYSWPGNVRELQNSLERAINVAEGYVIHLEDLPLYLQDLEGRRSTTSLQTLTLEMADAERRAIIKALKTARGNKTKAAEFLGIHRTNLYKKMEKYGLEGEISDGMV